MTEKSDQERDREIDRRKMILEMVQKAFPEAEVEEILLPRLNNPDCWEVAIRLKKPSYRSVIVRPITILMTAAGINLRNIFQKAIQEAKNILDNPPLECEDFQGTILLDHQGVPKYLKGEKADLC